MNNELIIFIILIILIIFITITFILTILTFKKTKTVEIKQKPDDILLHLSSETETILKSVNNFLQYNNKVSFISLNQISTNNSYDNSIDKYDIEDIIDYDYSTITNYKNHYIQGFTEIKDENNYLAHKINHSVPIAKPIKLVGKNGNFCYIMYLKRLKDDKKFYYIQLSQTFGGYTNSNSYKAVSEILQYLKKYYPGEYVITGDFNVQGHEKIFKHWLGIKNYHICPFYKYMTCNDNEGFASPDGIVISKELYKKVEYFIDIYPGYSYQHYIIGAKLYIDNKEIETKNIISQNFLNLLKEVKNITNRDNFINNVGIFDPTYNKFVGTDTNINIIPMQKSLQKVYRNKITTKMIEKIK